MWQTEPQETLRAKLYYYGEMDDDDTNMFRKGLAFPGYKDVVDYWDFVQR
jgi:uncharacterized membrane protein